MSDSHQPFQIASVEHTSALSESILDGRALVDWVTGVVSTACGVLAALSIVDSAAAKWLRRLTRVSMRLLRSLFSAFVTLSSARNLRIIVASSSGGVESSSSFTISSSVGVWDWTASGGGVGLIGWSWVGAAGVGLVGWSWVGAGG